MDKVADCTPGTASIPDISRSVLVEHPSRRLTLNDRVYPEHEQVVGVEADVDLAEVVKRPHEESSARKKDEADCHLHSEKRLAQDAVRDTSPLRACFE